MIERLKGALTTWPFLLALTLLIGNDWILKFAYPGVITGKISDFAGIAVIGILAYAAFPARRILITALIVVTFSWWKSPLSASVIEFFNSAGWLQIGRVVDYTDLLAFAILPMCTFVACKPDKHRIAGLNRRCVTVPVSLVALLGVMGTSVIPQAQQYQLRPGTKSAAIERKAISEVIFLIASDYELRCEHYDEWGSSGHCSNDKYHLRYSMSTENTVTFHVAGPVGGWSAFTGKSRVVVDAIRRDIKREFAARFDELEYVEELDWHPSDSGLNSNESEPSIETESNNDAEN